MTDAVIRIEGLGKRYELAHDDETAPTNFREVLATKMRHLGRRLAGRPSSRTKEEFWALRDVSFEIARGEVVGIIGRNGAGKSTFLKIVSRIVEPTEGRVRIRGRVASLLEVGTGFHPELSGRENIFLNGAILGMSRAEIRRRFDEIVAFAEIDRFLDTPVKRYSSGMYVRLAFAVAAHLEPEILIVDEVLAVGDGAFQKKCLGKMEEVRGSGRTILFVSHNMGAVKHLCSRGVLLREGRLDAIGAVTDVLRQYLTEHVTYSGSWKRTRPAPEGPSIWFEEATVRAQSGEVNGHVDSDGDFTIELRVRASASFERAQLAIRFTNQEAIPAFTLCSTDSTRGFVAIPEGRHVFRIAVPASLLMPGDYTLQIVAHVPMERMLDQIDNEVAVRVEDTGSHVTICRDNRLGVVAPILPWTRADG
jgi:lipopolysaccharide transport system ATP-binding protein